MSRFPNAAQPPQMLARQNAKAGSVSVAPMARRRARNAALSPVQKHAKTPRAANTFSPVAAPAPPRRRQPNIKKRYLGRLLGDR
jgi:hypothetical protein